LRLTYVIDPDQYNEGVRKVARVLGSARVNI